MARKPDKQPDKRPAVLALMQVKAAIPKIKRRLEELKALDIGSLDNTTGGHTLDTYSQKINATLREIYGAETLEYDEYSIDTFRPQLGFYYSGMDTSLRGNIDTVKDKVGRAIATLATLVDILAEQVNGDEEDPGNRIVRAYDGLELHPEIARAASKLYRDAHYANAIEASVKALNGLVRLRSGLEQDGTTLMERAFNPTNPIVKFNQLQDQSDKDEQKGFMQMFSGAVSGLRNPRAHGFIKDDPERALEFIAFVSLLAKLLDGAEV
ncbi:TIGR02391 family protein [Bosea sp. 685]|uniref:TIGR02391 family protein n=1 Tax=Bosea sp. 685 TaxID=3080057 RepID=UPI002893732F|nr:TIGR02391 family protein [Bosea sp. 685]WNJ91776.1 TIGR02391 family protein [Bosea sp. 685]